MNLLHLDSSIQGDGSASRALSAAIADRLRAADPGLTYRYRDLVQDPLPHLTLDAFGAAEAASVLDDFEAADVVVIGAAMYNFTIPTQLKAWIDRILVAGRTFRYHEAGAEGLAGGKRVLIAVTRGGHYREGSAALLEHAETYLRGVFAFIGVTDATIIVAEGLGISPEGRLAALGAAHAEIRAIAAGA